MRNQNDAKFSIHIGNGDWMFSFVVCRRCFIRFICWPICDRGLLRVHVGPTYERTIFPIRSHTPCNRTADFHLSPSILYDEYFAGTRGHCPNEWQFARSFDDFGQSTLDNQVYLVVMRPLWNRKQKKNRLIFRHVIMNLVHLFVKHINLMRTWKQGFRPAK